MTRSRGHSNADGDSTQGVAGGIADRLTGRGGALLVTLTMLTVGLTMAPTAMAQSMGDRVSDGDSDHLPVLEDVGDTNDFDAQTVCRISEGGSGKLDDAYYLHWGSDCTGDVDRDDIRLTDSDDGSVGEVVQSGDDDLNKQFDNNEGDFLSNVGYIEADGWSGFTEEDWVYWSGDGGGQIDASNGDIRLTDTDGGSPGDIIDSSSDSDLGEADDDDDEYPNSRNLQDQGSGWNLQFYDVDGDDDWDADEEPIYLTKQGSDDFVTINDVSLSSSWDHSYGDVLQESDDQVPRWLIELDGAGNDAHLVSTEETDDDTNERHLFIHFDDNDGDDDAILVGDIVIYHSSASLGDRVESESDGAGEQIDATANIESNIFFLDTTGSDDYTPDEDPVYLNRPSSLGGRNGSDLSADDIRLTDFESFSAGDIVESDDSDLTSYGGDSTNGGLNGEWKFMLFDEDRTNRTELQDLSDAGTTNGDWDENVDGAYISSQGQVSDGDRRLYTAHNLANTELSCVDGEANNGDYHGQAEHEDCGNDWHAGNEAGALANVPALNSTSSSWSSSESVVYDVDDSGDISDGDFLVYHPEFASATIDENDDDHDDLIGDDLQRDDNLRSTNRSSVSGDGNTSASTSTFSPGSHFVYHDADGDMNITDGDVRVFATWSGIDGSDPGVDSPADCENEADFNTFDADCETSLDSPSHIKVTGGDGDYEAAQSEYVYQSEDDIVNDADFRFLDYGTVETGTDVGMTDQDVNQLGVDTDDRLFLSWCEGSSCDHPTNRVRVGDVRLGNGQERTDASSSDYDVELSSITVGASDQGLKRYDLGSSGKIIDDALYLSFDESSDRLSQDDLRLTEFDGNDPGSSITSSDSQELSATVSRANNAFATYVDWADVDGSDGYTDGDPVYADLPEDLYTDGTAGTLSLGDVRLTEASASGDTFSAGTLVKTGDSDRSAYSLENSDPDQGSWTLYWHDADRNGDVDDDEEVYVNPGTQPGDSGVPNILSIRLSGEVSSTSSGGSGGGGGSGGSGGSDDGDTTTDPVSISISSPSDGETLDHDEDIAISGTASNVDFVSVTVNDTDLVVSGRTSWSATFADPEPGEYTIQATATGEQGGTATDTVTVTVAEPPEPEPVSVVISSPRSGASFGPGEQVDITGFASGDDLDVNVSVDGEDLTVTGSNQFSATWTTPEDSGDYEITATAIGDGGTATKSVPVSVTDGEPADGDGDGDGNDTEEPEDTPAPGVIAALLAIGAAVLIRRD